jgi:uncharacterized membrane protein
MNNFAYWFHIILGIVTIVPSIYFIIKNGIRKSDFTKKNIENLELKYGGISFLYLVLIIPYLIFMFFYY